MPPGFTILMFFKAVTLLSYLPVNILKTSIMSTLVRLYFKVGNFNRRSLSLYVKCLTVETNLVALIYVGKPRHHTL